MPSKFKLIPASKLRGFSDKPLCALCPEDWELIKRIRCSEGTRLNIWGSKTGNGRIAFQIETDPHRGHFHHAEEEVEMPENDFFIVDDFFDVEQLIELGATLTLRARVQAELT